MARIDPLGNPEYAYVQVARMIMADIRAGQITGQLPAERQLAREYAVSYMTVRRALALLRQESAIVTLHGCGSFVSPPARPQSPPEQ